MQLKHIFYPKCKTTLDTETFCNNITSVRVCVDKIEPCNRFKKCIVNVGYLKELTCCLESFQLYNQEWINFNFIFGNITHCSCICDETYTHLMMNSHG
jgi:hypothetical protein